MKTLILDANNLGMRAIHAMSRSGLTADGVATGPLLVFINCLSRHVKDEKPDRVVACWDSGASEFRLAIDPEYKAHRKAANPGFDDTRRTAFGLMKQWLSLAGVYQVERPGFEADDIIAHYVRDTMRIVDASAVILSSDKDFLQLLSFGVRQIRFSSADTPTDEWTAQRVMEEYGVSRRLFTYALALAGDVSDGVPGLPRFGMKTAVKALAKYDNDIDRLLAEHPVASLPEHQERFRKNLALVDLRTPAPGLVLGDIPPWEPTRPGSALYEDLLSFLTRYRMDSVKARIYDDTLWDA